MIKWFLLYFAIDRLILVSYLCMYYIDSLCSHLQCCCLRLILILLFWVLLKMVVLLRYVWSSYLDQPTELFHSPFQLWMTLQQVTDQLHLICIISYMQPSSYNTAIAFNAVVVRIIIVCSMQALLITLELVHSTLLSLPMLLLGPPNALLFKSRMIY